MAAMPIFVRVCTWVLVFYKLEALECSCAPLRLLSRFVTKLLCFCLCLFHVIDELHAMNEKMFNDFLIRN